MQREIEAAEDLLETAYIHINHLLQRLGHLSDRIASTELLVRIAMDRRRNELAGLELAVTNMSMGLAYVGTVGSVFGMNLWNVVYQDSKIVFLWVMAAMLVGCVALPAAVVLYMKRRKLTSATNSLP